MAKRLGQRLHSRATAGEGTKFPTIGVTGTDRYDQNADQAADQRIREIKLNPAPWYQASCS